MTEGNRQLAAPLPSTVVDLMNQRKSMRVRSLIDDVEDAFLKLWENEDFRKYVEPLFREETIEGSFIDDEVLSAQMIRDFAEEHNMAHAKTAKTGALRHALRIVLRRYGLSRAERLALARGQTVPAADDDDND